MTHPSPTQKEKSAIPSPASTGTEIPDEDKALLARAARREVDQVYGHAVRIIDGAGVVLRVIKNNSDGSWSLYGADPESGLRLSDNTMVIFAQWVIKITRRTDSPG